jgi:hypothetical protein
MMNLYSASNKEGMSMNDEKHFRTILHYGQPLRIRISYPKISEPNPLGVIPDPENPLAGVGADDESERASPSKILAELARLTSKIGKLSVTKKKTKN